MGSGNIKTAVLLSAGAIISAYLTKCQSSSLSLRINPAKGSVYVVFLHTWECMLIKHGLKKNIYNIATEYLSSFSSIRG